MTALLALATLLTIGTPCTNGRGSPSMSAPVTACLAPGTSVNVTAELVHADGFDWRHTEAGMWIASDFLGPQGAPVVIAASPTTSPATSSNSAATTAATAAQVVAEIDRQALGAGLRAACVEALALRESHDDPTAVNPSGARGLFGWMPDHGEWSSTPLGSSGLPVALATVQQDVAMAVWALVAGHGGGAWGQADGCK